MRGIVRCATKQAQLKQRRVKPGWGMSGDNRQPYTATKTEGVAPDGRSLSPLPAQRGAE